MNKLTDGLFSHNKGGKQEEVMVRITTALSLRGEFNIQKDPEKIGKCDIKSLESD